MAGDLNQEFPRYVSNYEAINFVSEEVILKCDKIVCLELGNSRPGVAKRF